MKWWDFQDNTFLLFFIGLIILAAFLIGILISFSISSKRYLARKKKIESESNSLRVYVINVKKNEVIYFNRSNIKNKKKIDLANFYDKFHPNDKSEYENYRNDVADEHPEDVKIETVGDEGRNGVYEVLAGSRQNTYEDKKRNTV